MTRRRTDWLAFAAIGLAAGFLSGLFGVGGGILIVPALVLAARFEQKLAAGTSLAAIVPTSLVGVVSYAMGGHVDWLAALLLAAGAIGGAQLGSLLLDRLPRRIIQWAFIGFFVVVIVSLFLVIPSRDSTIEITVVSGVGLVILGLVVGVLSGLLGIGGGVVFVPLLVLLFGASDLIAKGTSLLVMVPTAVSGTIANSLRKNVDLPAAIAIGLAACTTTALGAHIAGLVSPQTANILFAVFLVLVVLQLVSRAVKRPHP